MKRCLTSVIREMQVKITRDTTSHAHVMAKIKSEISVERNGELEPSQSTGGNVKWRSHSGKLWQFLKKVNGYDMVPQFLSQVDAKENLKLIL